MKSLRLLLIYTVVDFQLPDSKAKAPLTDLREYNGLHLATGKYQDGDECGTVSLDYYKITPLNLGNVEDEMIFSAPFSVSNQLEYGFR